MCTVSHKNEIHSDHIAVARDGACAKRWSPEIAARIGAEPGHDSHAHLEQRGGAEEASGWTMDMDKETTTRL